MPTEFPTGLVTVEVTQHWIDRGCIAANSQPQSWHNNCPVAHAVAAAGFPNPVVRRGDFSAGPVSTFDIPRRRLLYVLPVEAQAFIHRFDQSLHVDPFSFVIDADNATAVTYG